MSDQHHGRMQELDKQKQPDDDQHTSASGETQISYWALLDEVLVPEETPGSGDKLMSKEAGAERISQFGDTHDVDSLADAPATDMDIKVNLTQMAQQSAIAHTPTLRRSIATRAAKKHRFRSKSRDWWKKNCHGGPEYTLQQATVETGMEEMDEVIARHRRRSQQRGNL